MSSGGSSETTLHAAARRKASYRRTLGAVAWSFFGVRRSGDLERDARELNPVHVIVAGILAAVVFVVGLIVLVNWVVGSGVAR